MPKRITEYTDEDIRMMLAERYAVEPEFVTFAVLPERDLGANGYEPARATFRVMEKVDDDA